MDAVTKTENVRVLVVDDDEDDALLTCDAIGDVSNQSYNVTIALRPRDAEGILHAETIDVVLCDYLMGATSGIDFIKTVRSAGIDVPIILLTGMGNKTTDLAAMEAGASDFMSKDSITPDNIDRAIRYAIAGAERQRLMHTVLNNVNAAVALIDRNQHACLWNPKFAELADCYKQLQGEDIELHEFASRMLCGGSTVTIGDRVLDLKISHIEANDSKVIILHDVTEHVIALQEREAAEKRAAHLAMNCSLTGLPNRNAFADRLDYEIRDAVAAGREFYLLNVDLDKFKTINDVYGHAKGDEALKEIARRLSACCQGEEYIARLGGDEFMAVQPKLPGSDSVPALAERMAESMRQPLQLGDLLLHFGVSIGVAVFPQHGTTSEQLMSNSDIAMYRSKDDPLNRVFVFNESLDQQIRQERQISQDLRSAIENRELEVHFQPQADMINGEVTGFEALVRWTHPEFGPISPGTFIPLAEESGLITRLGEVVLSKACEIAATWETPAKIAVNVSPIQVLHVDLAALVREILVRSGLAPSRLELEVTESVLIDDSNTALHVLRGIKNLGVSVALDDFGTGYSSLSTLISFPFDKVKIDRSFVQNCTSNYQAAVVVRTMIGTANQLGFRIIAEGVERQDQVEFLIKEGCQEMQGFLIGRPVSERELKFTLDDLMPQADTLDTATCKKAS